MSKRSNIFAYNNEKTKKFSKRKRSYEVLNGNYEYTLKL